MDEGYTVVHTWYVTITTREQRVQVSSAGGERNRLSGGRRLIAVLLEGGFKY